MAGLKSTTKRSREDDAYAQQIIDEHNALLDKYKGTDYEKYFTSNPYIGMEAVGGFLGIGRRQQQRDILNQLKAYDAQSLRSVGELEYQLPVKQAQRESEAGLNSDLTGLGSGPSMPGSSEAQVPQSPDPAQQVLGVTDTLLNIASIAMSIPESLSGLAGQNIQNALQKINAARSIEDLAGSHVTDFEDIPVQDDGSISAEDVTKILQASVSNGDRSEYLAKTLFPDDKRLQKQFAQSFKSQYNTTRNRLIRANNSKDLINLLNSPEFTEGFPEVARLAAFYSIKAQMEEAKIRAEYAEKRAKFAEDNPDRVQSMIESEYDVSDANTLAAQSAARAASSNAAAAAAESKVRVAAAKATDGTKLGEATTAEALAKEEESKLKAADDKVLREFSDELDRLSESENLSGFGRTVARFHRHKQAKRRRERSSGSSISPGDLVKLLK